MSRNNASLPGSRITFHRIVTAQPYPLLFATVTIAQISPYDPQKLLVLK
jgi:hypothetical protein